MDCCSCYISWLIWHMSVMALLRDCQYLLGWGLVMTEMLQFRPSSQLYQQSAILHHPSEKWPNPYLVMEKVKMAKVQDDCLLSSIVFCLPKWVGPRGPLCNGQIWWKKILWEHLVFQEFSSPDKVWKGYQSLYSDNKLIFC